MAGYISSTKINLHYDDAPAWFQTFLRRRRIKGHTAHTVLTNYVNLREFFRYVAFVQKYGHNPTPSRLIEKLDENGKIVPQIVNEIPDFRATEILELSIDTVARIQKRDIHKYLEFITDTLGNEPATINKKLTAVRIFYEYIVDEQDEMRDGAFPDESEEFRRINCLHVSLEASPAAKIEAVKQPITQPVFLPESAMLQLLESTSGPDYDRDYAIILLFLTTGIRLSELCAINLQDITEDRLRIKGKGQKTRTVFLTASVQMAIEDYIENYRAPLEENLQDKNALFVSSRRCKRLSNRAVQKMLKRQLRAANLNDDEVTVHKLRHTAATMLVNNGADLLTVQRMLGHSSPETTVKYTHLAPNKIKEAVEDSVLGSLGVRKSGLSKEALAAIVASDLALQRSDFSDEEDSDDE